MRVIRLTREERRLCPAVALCRDGRCQLLAQLCHPLTPTRFLNRHWRKHALVVHGGRQRFAALVRDRLFGLRLPVMLRASPSEEIHVWFAARTGVHGANESIKVADRQSALACHRAGASLYFRAPPDASDLLVTALSQQVGLSFGALHVDGAPRSEVETFVSRAGHVTEWHFDFMENFTLQISGVKRWHLKRSSVEAPVRGCTPQWSVRGGAGADAVRSAAETQAVLHAQHAHGAFDAKVRFHAAALAGTTPAVVPSTADGALRACGERWRCSRRVNSSTTRVW